MSWKNDQVTNKETAQILAIARDCLGVPGDFVEFGCYRGDTSLLLADIIRNSDKSLWLYDSFEGLPEKSASDQPELNPEFRPGALSTSKRALKLRFLRSNTPVPIIKKAWFNELNQSDLPRQISFAFLDGDLYDSIRDSLRLIFPVLHPQSKIVIHDYYNHQLPGVKKAVDEFLNLHPQLKQAVVLL